jgi:hypothetical protein
MATSPSGGRSMATPRVSLPTAAITSVALIADNADKLALLGKVVDSMNPAMRTTSRVIKEFATQAKLSPGDARKIVTQIMSVSLLIATTGRTPDEIFDSLTQTLTEDYANNNKVNLEKWRDAKPFVVPLLSPEHSIGILQKATKLRYDHQNILHNANIITDLRPVFDGAGREIQLMIATYMLQIDYTEGGVRKALSAALDAKDVAKLKSICERAETKTATLKDKLKGQPWPILISGDTDDE